MARTTARTVLPSPSTRLAALALALALAPAAALAQEGDDDLPPFQPDGSQRACLLEGRGAVMGQPFEARDCVEARGMPEEAFRQTCEGMSQAAVQFGGPPATITWLATCPGGAQARCDMPAPMPGLAMGFVYYARDAELLATSREGCAQMGGTWREG